MQEPACGVIQISSAVQVWIAVASWRSLGSSSSGGPGRDRRHKTYGARQTRSATPPPRSCHACHTYMPVRMSPTHTFHSTVAAGFGSGFVQQMQVACFQAGGSRDAACLHDGGPTGWPRPESARLTAPQPPAAWAPAGPRPTTVCIAATCQRSPDSHAVHTSGCSGSDELRDGLHYLFCGLVVLVCELPSNLQHWHPAPHLMIAVCGPCGKHDTTTAAGLSSRLARRPPQCACQLSGRLAGPPRWPVARQNPALRTGPQRRHPAESRPCARPSSP